MSRRTRTAAMLLSSAALITAGAPAGAVANNGHGDKRGGHHGHARGHDRGLARTARELGVTKQQLRTALKAVAAQQKAAAKPPSFKTLFAQELGVTTDQLKAASKQARATTHSKDEYVQALASALGVDAAKVTTAFTAARDAKKAQWKAKRDAFVAALAQELNVPQDKVEAAFDRKCGFKHR